MQETRVAVLRGGPSAEYEISLQTGREVLKHLPERYRPLDVFISKGGEWHVGGVVKTPAEALSQSDVVFNALHGTYGEDGKVQKILDDLGMPYTGSGVVPSALAMNKVLTKRTLWQHNLQVPIYTTINVSHDIPKRALAIFRTIPQPSVVKPADSGSSIGVSIVRNFEELLQGIYDALEVSDTAIVEEYIAGREATCAVVENFRGQSLYAFFPIEIMPLQSDFFDYKAKYGGGSEEICPGRFSSEEKRLIQQAAQKAHHALGLRHYSRSDFIVHPRRGVYFLETNTLPGLTTESLVPKSIRAAGGTLSEFLGHVISLAEARP